MLLATDTAEAVDSPTIGWGRNSCREPTLKLPAELGLRLWVYHLWVVGFGCSICKAFGRELPALVKKHRLLKDMMATPKHGTRSESQEVRCLANHNMLCGVGLLVLWLLFMLSLEETG